MCSGFIAGAFPLDVKGLDTTRTAVMVYDLTFGRPVVQANVTKPLIPASIMKSVTAASVLNLADSYERFMTPVVTEGVAEGGVLHGNIVIKASGDPTIESEHFPEACHFADSIAASLRAAGISRVDGRVIVDESGFIHTGTPDGWMKEDLTWPYGTDLHGANFRDNKFILRLPSRVTEPHVPGLDIRHINQGARARSVKRQDGSSTVTFSGRIPPKGWSDRLSTPDPAKVMQHEVTETLRKSGIEIGGENISPSSGSTLLYTHFSPTFDSILRSLMHRSDNMMAEGMLRALRPGASRDDAIAEEMKIWNDKGISTSGLAIEDGSGLSRNDRMTAAFMTEMLRSMLGPEYGRDYISLFPVAGRDGTMKNTFVDTPLEGSVALKTGSMKGVRSFAGYRFDESGTPTHVIVVIANGLRCKPADLKKGLESLLMEIF
ncbi:MAG: D-alanyl-D-alanine carboxypeptidase/D-alanyl-D-alanine-endopeptidase [Duncaniella sp.]|nr:D-alanyl-D-alanine carboxypeptidase/D-alanyl-D-alanine-endopeptidase [Duncaniella sp.]